MAEHIRHIDPKYRAAMEKWRLRERDRLADTLVRLGPEFRDPANPKNPFAASPFLDWKVWHESVPRSWEHGEDRAHRHGQFQDGAVLKTYTPRFMGRLADTAYLVSSVFELHGIEVSFWYECQTRPDLIAGRCFPKMSFQGESVGNCIMLSSREPSDLLLLYYALHEGAHCIPEPSSDFDPTVETLGHHECFRRRFGVLLHDFLMMDTEVPDIWHHRLRQIAMLDTWGPPIHPLDGWRWDEVPVRPGPGCA